VEKIIGPREEDKIGENCLVSTMDSIHVSAYYINGSFANGCYVEYLKDVEVGCHDYRFSC
jgi:hypothetical protein